jgi:hypothetical protein
MVIRAILAAFLALTLTHVVAAAPLEEEQVFLQVNSQRAANNLPPLVRSLALDAAAERHCDDLATMRVLAHIGSDGSNPGQRITEAGYRWTAYGENVAAGYLTAQGVMDAWMGSPGHRANILNPGFREMGVAHLYLQASPYGSYWVQVFASRADFVPPPPPPPVPVGELPNLVLVTPRSGFSGRTEVTLTGRNFGETRGDGHVTVLKRMTGEAAGVSYLSWSPTRVVIKFQARRKGWHFVQLTRGDGRASISALFYVRQ